MANAERREVLLEATVRVVAQKGLRGLTFRAVAEEAGVSHSLVAHHFGNRDALILAAFREQARSHYAAEQEFPGSGRIDLIGSRLAEIVSESAEEERYQYEMILESFRSPEYRDEVKLLYQRFVQGVENELRLAGADKTGPLAQVVFAALDGLVLQQLISGDTEAMQDALERLRAMIRADIAVSRLKESFDSR